MNNFTAIPDFQFFFLCRWRRSATWIFVLFFCSFLLHFSDLNGGRFCNLAAGEGANANSEDRQTHVVMRSADTNAQAMLGNLKMRETPWGGFLPGTWVVRRTNTQRNVGESVVNNVTDTLLSLEEVNESGMKLRQEAAIGIADGTFSPDPKLLLLDFNMQPVTEGVEIERLQPQTVIVARRQIVCQVCRYTQTIGDQKKTTTLWISDTVMPYLLRSEEIRTNLTVAGQPETVLSHTVMMVTDTSGIRLLKNLLSDYKTQTIRKTSSGTIISQASLSTNIPGGLLREVTVETDNANKVVGRSVTSAIDYFVACPGVPVRERRLYSEASQEIQSSWNDLSRETGTATEE